MMGKHRERARYLHRSSGTFSPEGEDRTVDYDNHVFEIFGGRVKVRAEGDVSIPPLKEGEECELVYEGLTFVKAGNYLIPQAQLVEIAAAGNLKAVGQ